ncbi:unnamed protein product [Caenorhabditis nigoni]
MCSISLFTSPKNHIFSLALSPSLASFASSMSLPSVPKTVPSRWTTLRTLIFIALIIDIMTRPIARVPKKNNVTLKALVKKLERQNAHQRKIINSQADHIIQTELTRRAVIDNHRSFEASKEKILELEGENKEMGEEMAQVNQENLKLKEEIQRASSSSVEMKNKMELLEQEISQLRKQGEIRERVVTIKKEIEEENEEIAKPVRTKATSYVYDANNGNVPQTVKEASAVHFFYRGHFAKTKNYTRWSDLGTAERDKWTNEWAKMRKVQKEQAAQGLIILRTQIKEELEDGPKWAMVLRTRR